MTRRPFELYVTESGITFRVEISECPCDCGTCGQLVDDGGECLLCRTSVHDASDE